MKLRSFLIVGMLLTACTGGETIGNGAGEVSSTVTEDGAATTGHGDTTTSLDTTTAPTETTGEPPPSSDPATAGLGGEWWAVLTHLNVFGPCPPTPTQQGPVMLQVEGGTFTLVFDEGFHCDPIEACEFGGTIEVRTLDGANAGVADDQGGVYESAFTVVWDGADRIEGTGESAYTHPDTQCRWDTTLVMTRITD
jgi:hypothetical protein